MVETVTGMTIPVARFAIVPVVLSLFLERIVAGLYQGLDRDLPDPIPVLGTVLLMTSLYTWFWCYSQERRIPWVMDMGWFLFAAWIVILPYYILKVEGRGGWSRIGLFSLTCFAAYATGWAVLIWTRLLAGGAR
jgi:hypothetical protein